jgi:hypothetical protein
MGLVVSNLERGIALMNLLDEEEKSRGYMLKKEGYRGEVLAMSPKASIERASIGDVKTAVQRLVTEKVDALNALQSIYPVETSCGGAQLFIEKANIVIAPLLNNGNCNPQNYLSCFFQSPENPGLKRQVSLRYYRTHSGKCQYLNFYNDLRGIFGETIAASIADHKKVLKAASNKYAEVQDIIERTLFITPDEISAINAQFSIPVIS